jgi:DNA polymerase elongation subunit (family B)
LLYTSVQEQGRKLYYRGYKDDGSREQYIVGSAKDPCPELVNNYYHFRMSDKGRIGQAYKRIKDSMNIRDYKKCIRFPVRGAESDLHCLDGEDVFELIFDYRDTRNIRDLLKTEFSDIKIYSDIDFKYKYIRGRNAFDTLKHPIKIAYLDIETETEGGFAKPEDPTERVNCISMRIQDGKMYVWALGHVVIEKDDVILRCFENEYDLLKDFVDTWRILDFDIISGWNINHFDLPYLYHRIYRIIGEKYAQRLSPFDVVVEKLDKNNFTFAATEAAVDIIGIQILDYLDVYKKHTYENRENYKLNTIAHAELGEGKIDYAKFKNLQGLYKKDFQLFVEYNMQDTDLVYKLEIALRLISLVCYLAYMSKINFEDVKSGTQTWDVIIFNHLYDTGYVIKPKEKIEKSGTYPGAYVRDPLPGHYKYILSFDATSLYPSLIRQQNISAETITDTTYDGFKKYHGPADTDEYEVDGLINFQDDLSWLKEKNLCLSPSGCTFRRDKQGFAPFLMEKFFKERKAAKKEMLKLEQESQNLMAEIEKRGLTPKYCYRKPHH